MYNCELDNNSRFVSGSIVNQQRWPEYRYAPGQGKAFMCGHSKSRDEWSGGGRPDDTEIPTGVRGGGSSFDRISGGVGGFLPHSRRGDGR